VKRGDDLKEFLNRLKESCLNVMGFIFALIGVLIFILLVVALIVVLPIWLLEFLIGDYAMWWFFVLIVIIPVLAEWNSIKNWFMWQFIEPFRK